MNQELLMQTGTYLPFPRKGVHVLTKRSNRSNVEALSCGALPRPVDLDNSLCITDAELSCLHFLARCSQVLYA